MRIFITGIILVFAAVFQSTWMHYIEIWNIRPNLTIMVIIYFALLRGNVEGAVVGFFGGLLLDILGGKAIGINSLLGMYIGVVAGSFNKRFYKDNYFVAILFTFIYTFLFEFIFYLLSYFLWGETKILYAIYYIILPETIYNCILAVPLYAFIIKINRWFNLKERNIRRY